MTYKELAERITAEPEEVQNSSVALLDDLGGVYHLTQVHPTIEEKGIGIFTGTLLLEFD